MVTIDGSYLTWLGTTKTRHDPTPDWWDSSGLPLSAVARAPAAPPSLISKNGVMTVMGEMVILTKEYGL